LWRDGLAALRRGIKSSTATEYADACSAMLDLYHDAHDDPSLADSIRAIPGRMDARRWFAMEAESGTIVAVADSPEAAWLRLEAVDVVVYNAAKREGGVWRELAHGEVCFVWGGS
jgi:hypothetical protein